MKLLFLILSLCFIPVCLAQETVTKDYLMGKFNPAKDKRFVKTGEFFLRKEVAEAFSKMKKDAAKSKVKLTLVSATRTFFDQKTLWENKWKGITPVNTDTKEFLPKPNSSKNKLTETERAFRILEFSAMPSTSRHHWGTDFDINKVEPSYWETPKGQKEYAWLSENAERFGFCQVYSADRTKGYKEEKWHWSYLPLARNFTVKYAELITNKDISNLKFIGSETANSVDAVGNFVLEINRQCK